MGTNRYTVVQIKAKVLDFHYGELDSNLQSKKSLDVNETNIYSKIFEYALSS